MNEPVITLRGIAKQYKNVAALVDINLDIARGEFFSLLGPSGCGKTTLLRLIAGFEEPTTGEITIAGRNMSGIPPHKRPVNMVFQNYALFPHMSVFDNVAFGLRSAKNISAAEISNRVDEALQLVHLEGLYGRFPSQLSGGQQQRVALARAVVNRPDVLLLDEPLSALDSKIRQKMQDELANLHQELGLTFIMVTHDQGEALALSNRLAVFYMGRIQQVGEPKQIFESPKTTFVADFVGHTNLLQATVRKVESNYLMVDVSDALQLWVSNNAELAVTEGADVTVWVRTQALKIASISKDGDNSNAQPSNHVDLKGEKVNSFRALITQRSYQGSFIVYYLEINEDIKLRCSCSATEMDGFAVGQSVLVSFMAEAASVFSAKDPHNQELLLEEEDAEILPA